MLYGLILRVLITLVLIVIVILLPSVYDLGGFSRVYDLHELVGKEFTFTKPVNIISHYFPSPSIQTTANVTYSIDPLANTILLKINNIDYTYQLADSVTKQIVIPILLGAQVN